MTANTEVLIGRLEELKQNTKNKAAFQRLQSVCLHLKEQMTAEEISTVVDFSVDYIRRLWSKCRYAGPEALLREGRGGRYHQNMSEEEEKVFLKPFFKEAEKGGVLVITKIKKAYEKQLGRKVPKSTIYAMLHRHGWRKIAPRPSHPKADKLAQERFKASFPPQGISGKTGS